MCAFGPGLLLNSFLAASHLLRSVYGATLGALSHCTAHARWTRVPFYEFVLSAVWSVLWLAGAGAVSHQFQPFSNCSGGKACDLANTLLAFSWLSWLFWCAVTALTATVWGMGIQAACSAQPATTSMDKNEEVTQTATVVELVDTVAAANVDGLTSTVPAAWRGKEEGPVGRASCTISDIEAAADKEKDTDIGRA